MGTYIINDYNNKYKEILIKTIFIIGDNKIFFYN